MKRPSTYVSYIMNPSTKTCMFYILSCFSPLCSRCCRLTLLSSRSIHPSIRFSAVRPVFAIVIIVPLKFHVLYRIIYGRNLNIANDHKSTIDTLDKRQVLSFDTSYSSFCQLSNQLVHSFHLFRHQRNKIKAKLKSAVIISPFLHRRVLEAQLL